MRDFVCNNINGEIMSEAKTNAMRMLDKLKTPYKSHVYECAEFTDGVQIAQLLGQDLKKVYKTLVTVAKSGKYYVFVIPVDREMDLKKCAASVGEKSLSPIHVKDIQSVTGYIRGGCSPIGMKKQFRTVINESAKELDSIIVSGGRLGLQLEMTPENLIKACSGEYAHLTVDSTQ